MRDEKQNKFEFICADIYSLICIRCNRVATEHLRQIEIGKLCREKIGSHSFFLHAISLLLAFVQNSANTRMCVCVRYKRYSRTYKIVRFKVACKVVYHTFLLSLLFFEMCARPQNHVYILRKLTNMNGYGLQTMYTLRTQQMNEIWTIGKG